MAEIHKNSTGLSGEYFVAAELYRRGWSVAITLGNAKSIDLFAEKNGKAVSIQVKSLFKRSNNSFPISKKSLKENCIYVFVILNGDKLPAPPQFYICTYSEIVPLIKEYESRDVVTVGSVANVENENGWGKLEK